MAVGNRPIEPRTLVQICEQESPKGDFHRTIHGINYCGIKITRAGVECPYRAKHEDHNGLMRCNNLKYMGAITLYKYLM